MAIARRLYLYVIAGVTLAMLIGALITLINLALEISLGSNADLVFGGNSQGALRGQLSLVLATIAVALPVWAFHWGVAERSVRAVAAGGAAERSSAVRALYLTIVLLALLIALITSGTQLLRYLLSLALGAAPSDELGPISAAATLAVVGAFWGYHALVRWRDLRTPMVRAAAWLPRTYRYLATLIGLLIMLYGIVRLIELAGDSLGLTGTGLIGGTAVRPSALADVMANIGVGLLVWIGHWAYSIRMLDASDWRAPAERESRTRAGYYVVVLFIGLTVAVSELALALATILRAVLGAETVAQRGDVAREIIGSVLIGLVFAGVWWAHRLAMIRERGHMGVDQARSARRVDAYTVALIAVSSGATALAWLLGLAIDVLGRGQRTLAGSDDWRAQLASFLALVIIGSVIWLLDLRQVHAGRTADEVAESRSTARRAYLLLTIAGSVLAGLSGLLLILNRFIGSLIGATVQRNLTSELSTPLGVLIVAILLGGLHFWWLRRDQRVVAGESEEATQLVPLAIPTAPASIERRLVLTAPAGADVSGALERLRAELPDGYRLEEGG